MLTLLASHSHFMNLTFRMYIHDTCVRKIKPGMGPKENGSYGKNMAGLSIAH